MLPLAMLVGLGPLVRWKGDDWRRHARRLWPLLLGSLAIGLAWAFYNPSPRWWLTAAGLGSAFWIIASTLLGVADRMRRSRGPGVKVQRLRPAFLRWS